MSYVTRSLESELRQSLMRSGKESDNADRLCTVLFDEYGLSHTEIAKAVFLSPSAVAYRINRWKRKVAKNDRSSGQAHP